MIGTLRRELFDRLLIVNERYLRQVLTEYVRHYNTAGRTVPLASSHQPKLTPAIGDQPRRAPDPPKARPRRTNSRVPDRRLTTPRCPGNKQVTATIVYSGPTGRRPVPHARATFTP